MKRIILSLAASAALAACATTPPPPPAKAGQEASIPFLNHRGVDNWAADGDRAIYLQDAFRRWYHATLFAPCTELSFATAIGIETRGNDTLDKFGTILVRGQRCPMESLVASGPPPKKLKKHKGEQAEKQ